MLDNARPKHRKARSKSQKILRIISFMLPSLLLIPGLAISAEATATVSFGVYLDQPFVQNSYVYTSFPSESKIIDFDDQSAGDACSVDSSIATITAHDGGGCFVGYSPDWGGATSTSSDPAPTGYSGTHSISVSNYAAIYGPGAAITFSTPQTYLGMWWSAGSPGNQIDLYSGDTLVATTNADDINTAIRSGGTLTSQDSQSYNTGLYLGNPADWYAVNSPSDYTQTDSSNYYERGSNVFPHAVQSIGETSGEPFVYIHFFGQNGNTFDRIELKAPGNGFELDSIVTSSKSDIPILDRLVSQKNLYVPVAVSFDSNGQEGTMPDQYSSGLTALNSITSCDPFNYLGWIIYRDCLYTNTPNKYFNGWNTEPDGSGTAYENTGVFDFVEPTTLYAQWIFYFHTVDIDNGQINQSAGDFAPNWDGAVYNAIVLQNGSDLVLPSASRPDYYLEGWYASDPDNSTGDLDRLGSPGDHVSEISYAKYGYPGYLFARWLPGGPTYTAPNATTPLVIPVDPRLSTALVPRLPLLDASEATICLTEVDNSQNPISNGLDFVDNTDSSSGFTSSFTISQNTGLVTTSSRFIRIAVADALDVSCSSPNYYYVEIKPLEISTEQRLTILLSQH